MFSLKKPICVYCDFIDLLRSCPTPSATKGFVGHEYSFGGQYFKGYRGMYKNASQFPKAVDRVLQVGSMVSDVEFYHGDYTQFSDLSNYIIYCDPPYSSYNAYYDETNKRKKFNTSDFWKWVKSMSDRNLVFVTEYEIPKHISHINLFSILHTNKSNSGYNTDQSKRENLYAVYQQE